jgi:SAM-dependent methyltransferase
MLRLCRTCRYFGYRWFRLAGLLVGIALLGVGGYQVSRSVAWRMAKYAAEEPQRKQQERQQQYVREMQEQREIIANWRQHDRHAGPRSPFYFVAIANLFKQVATQHFGSLKGLNIVEIGPGSSLINGALFVSAGAARYRGVDPYVNPAMRDALPYHVAFDLAHADPQYFIRPETEIIAKEADGKLDLNPNYISFVARNSYETGLPDNSVDYLFSMATIEHLDEPDRSIAEWKRIMKPGAISAHYAAAVDHRDMTKPYDHLKVDPAEWMKRFAPGGVYPPYSFFNQMRPIDFVRAFERAGFEIVEYRNEPPTAYLLEQARELYPNRSLSDVDWQKVSLAIKGDKTREEVEKLFIMIVVRKPKAS